MDRNDYYGGESTSLNLMQLWKHFKGDEKPPETLGSSRDYNVDMFMMANGSLVRIPIHTDVTKYLNFEAVDGSFVYKSKIYKVPATDVEALKSPLMGLFEKCRARKFFIYVHDYEDNDLKSHEGLDLNVVTAKELISYYGLEDNTIDFIGHALALYSDDSYLDQPVMSFVKRMKLYVESLARFQGGSPYIYPLYGLGELPQVEFDDDGKVIGVTSEWENRKVQKVGKVARAICIISHPIPDTNDSHSALVILPQKQLGRKSDMFADNCLSYLILLIIGVLQFLRFAFDIAEAETPKVELEPGIKSYDPTTHFETTVNDVIQMYTKITGKALDLSVDLSAASATEE
ncbi:Guanosine nucleotide diphosphate dissociation inhibitor [Hibiscus syriacus]|uniref:Guanosine nucleotide diphosphate dissociation inhibitor n=1 Tax=Hibiscus syriacus TaxID=106335 RepID=A0A6A2ZMA5_HIBSY|nr:Guanosine nucleotide diphosphate dissociation inhibitor [Hibiscus syriacus]